MDVVVTDVSLPGLSGLDFARQLLAEDPARCIVVCTGFDLGAHAKLLSTNVRTLLKPFEIEYGVAGGKDLCGCPRCWRLADRSMIPSEARQRRFRANADA